VGVPFTTVQDLYIALRSISDHSRPAYDPEILGALNFGYKETIRAIASVRSELFASFVNSFVLPANTKEIDVTMLDPPFMRPTRLMATPGSMTPILFRYRALHSQDYEDAELIQQAGTFNWMIYDVLWGRFPGVQQAIVSATAGNITVPDSSKFPFGSYITMPIPPRQILDGAAATAQPFYVDTYYGMVMGKNGNILQVYPSIPSNWTIPAGTLVTQMMRVILRIANPSQNQITGQLWYQYRPARLVNFTEIIDPLIAEHQDMLLYYALHQYLAAVNDSEASSYLQKAQLLKSELMQDIEPLSGQNSEAIDSALWGLG